MTPLDQIQEAGDIAAKKIRNALSEFVQSTGAKPEVDVLWTEFERIDNDGKIFQLEKVEISVMQKVSS